MAMGKISAVCLSKHKGTPKKDMGSGTLEVGFGFKGDAHGGDWHRQVSLLSIEQIATMKEKGLEVSRPSNSPPKEVIQDKGPIVVKIDSSSLISVKGRMLKPGATEAVLEREKAEKPESPLIIAAHPAADTESLVTVLDAAKAVGIESVSVATSSQ